MAAIGIAGNAVFYSFGIINNVYALFRLWDARTWPRIYGKIASLQLSFNIANIILHEVAEVSNQHIWFFLSTAFSFLSIYFLAALVFSVALGKRFKHRLNSYLFIAILSLTFCALFHLFGRRDLLCKNENCFSASLANTEDLNNIIKSSVAFFFVPTGVIISGSIYFGFQKYNSSTASKPEQSLLQVCSRVLCACPVAIFILYGLFVMEALLRSHHDEGKEMSPNHYLCRLICLDDQLFLLLSMFPVYVGYFFKRKSEEKLPQQSQET